MRPCAVFGCSSVGSTFDATSGLHFCPFDRAWYVARYERLERIEQHARHRYDDLRAMA